MLSRAPLSAGRLLLWARQPPARQLQQRIPLSRTSQKAYSQSSRRFQSATASGSTAAGTIPSGSGSSSSSSSSGVTSALTGGLAGGGLAFLLGYLWYQFSGAKALIRASKKTQAYIETAKQKAASTAADLEPNQAIDWLRDTSVAYVGFVPGAKKYVNAAFDDLDRIREQHGDEVDNAVKEAYTDLKQLVSKKGATFETAAQAWQIISKFVDRVGSLAVDAAQDILDNHPQIKQKLGGRVDQLKQLGDTYGPEVKKEVNKTWQQLSELVKSSSASDAMDKAYKLIQEKTEKVKGMVDDMWNKGMEQAKPYLDRNPQVKKLIEENKDALKKADFSQLWDTAKEATESGNMDNLNKFVREKTQNAKDSGVMGGLDKLLQMVPGGEQIAPKLEMLQKITEKRGKEAEQIMRETVEEIQEVLKKRVEQAKEVADKAKKDT